MLLACKNYELSHKMKSGVSEDQKKVLGEERKKLYSAAASRSEEEKKSSMVAHKGFFTRAYAKFCSEKPTTDVCTDLYMKKNYGGEKPFRKKAKKTTRV